MSKPFNIHDWQSKQRLTEHTVTFTKDDMATLHNTGKLVKADEDGKDHTYMFSEDLDEMNVTGTGASFNAGTGTAYATPNAFKKKKKVNEVSYSKFKSKTNSSPKQKIANGINQINKMIKEVEKIVAHNFRLKTELNMNSGTFFTSTNKRVHEIGARLKRLENKLREFSN